MRQPVRAHPQAGRHVIALTDREGVRTVRMTHTARRNALDEALAGSLREALEDAARDPAVRAVVLTGSDGVFSAGGDLRRFADRTSPGVFRLDSHRLSEVITLPERIDKPVLAAVNGTATGAGLQLALACDLRLAAASATVRYREGLLGLLPAHGGCARLVALVGLGRARDLVLGGEDLDAAAAYRAGLWTAVVEDGDLEEAVHARALRMTRRGAAAYGAAKRVLQLSAGVGIADGMAVETLAQAALAQTNEHHDRVARALAAGSGESQAGGA